MNENVFEPIKEELCDLYGKAASLDSIDNLAKELTDVVLDDSIGLDDISSIIETFEFELKTLEYSKVFDVTSTIIDLIPVTKAGTIKLYNFFMDNVDDLNALVKLLNECKEFLSPEQYRSLREKAKGCFDKQKLNFSTANWEEQ